MVDLTITRDGELMVAGVQGETARGIDFVDAYVDEQLVVADSGHVVLPESRIAGLVEQARELGVTYDEVDR
jgi:hypothetical protein